MELRDLQARHHVLAPLFSVKRQFVQRKAITGISPEQAGEIDGFAVAAELEAFLLEPLTELSFATHVARGGSRTNPPTPRPFTWLPSTPPGQHSLPSKAKPNIKAGSAIQNTAQAGHAASGACQRRSSPLRYDTFQFGPGHWRHREGFELTDPGSDLTGALDQAHYCIKCHNQAKDSCSTGLKEKERRLQIEHLRSAARRLPSRRKDQ